MKQYSTFCFITNPAQRSLLNKFSHVFDCQTAFELPSIKKCSFFLLKNDAGLEKTDIFKWIKRKVLQPSIQLNDFHVHILKSTPLRQMSGATYENFLFLLNTDRHPRTERLAHRMCRTGRICYALVWPALGRRRGLASHVKDAAVTKQSASGCSTGDNRVARWWRS